LITRETVIGDTPALRATSRMVSVGGAIAVISTTNCR
jgi:hypothetical protein